VGLDPTSLGGLGIFIGLVASAVSLLGSSPVYRQAASHTMSLSNSTSWSVTPVLLWLVVVIRWMMVTIGYCTTRHVNRNRRLLLVEVLEP
jgi:uncharacterized membrane protein YjfL (UPF0719 family)